MISFPDVRTEPPPPLDAWDDYPEGFGVKGDADGELFGVARTNWAHTGKNIVHINPKLSGKKLCRVFLHELGHIVHGDGDRDREFTGEDSMMLQQHLGIDVSNRREALAECYALKEMGTEFPPKAESIYRELR